jgi:hypothetical protein
VYDAWHLKLLVSQCVHCYWYYCSSNIFAFAILALHTYLNSARTPTLSPFYSDKVSAVNTAAGFDASDNSILMEKTVPITSAAEMFK